MRTTNTSMAAASVRGLLFLGALMLATCYVDEKNRNVFRLQILHTNDMHSNFTQYNKSGMYCIETDEECFGGFPRIKEAAKEQIEKARNDPTVDGTVFLNAGDTFQGTAFYSVFHWHIVAKLLPELPIDVMSLGNHEFDSGVGDLGEFLDNIKIPVVAANLDASKAPELFNKPILMKSKILEVKGRKIGIIGYLTPETATLSKPGNDVKFEHEIPSIRAEANRLKNDYKVNIIIALGHSGYEMDKKIAEEVEEVDVVVGGHSNTFLYSGKPPSVEKPVGPYPFCITQPNNKKVPVVQAYHITKYLGQLWVDFDDDGNVLKSYGNPILMDSSVHQDNDLLNKVNEFQERFDAATKKIIGKTEVYLEGYDLSCRLRECNFGVFITDAFIDYNIIHYSSYFDSNLYWTDAPIALQQSGGIRNNIDNDENQGNITYYMLMSAIPFRNKIGKVNMKGKDIKQALDNAFYKYDGKTPRGEFLQVSGLEIVVDFAMPEVHRVTSIKVRSNKINEKTIYYNLDLEANYWVLMSEYMWEGGDGFTFDKTDKTFTGFGVSDFEIVREQIERNTPIAPTTEGRITLLNVDKIPSRTAAANIPKVSRFKPLIFDFEECGNNA